MTDLSVPSDHTKQQPPSYSGYTNGCRCQGCREASRSYQREAQRKWRANNHERYLDNQRRWTAANRQRRVASTHKYLKSPHGKAVVKSRMKRRAARFREMVNAIKLERGCADCGYKEHAVALHFDHVRGQKVMNVSYAATRWVTMKRILTEIEKCDVVCANCHSVRTHKRRMEAKLNGVAHC